MLLMIAINQRVSLLLVSLLLLFSTSSLAGRSGNLPVVILTLDWSSQIVLSHITGRLLQKKGLAVSYYSYPSKGQWYLMKMGKVDVQIEVWPKTIGNKFDMLVQQQKVVDAGSHNVLAREEWWYPLHVKNLCPQLPDWRALFECKDLFVTKRSYPQAQYLTGPWVMNNKARIRALGLDFKVIELTSGKELNNALIKAVKLNKPILLYNWSPNWLNQVYPGEFVDFPAYDKQCINDPKWGVSDKWLWDCGSPTDSKLKKAVSLRLAQHNSCALAIIKAIRFEKTDFEQVSLWVNVKKLTSQQAAERWLNNNRARWSPWINHQTCLDN